jgi:predicted DNA-binding transcriptional regulator AlpA
MKRAFHANVRCSLEGDRMPKIKTIAKRTRRPVPPDPDNEQEERSTPPAVLNVEQTAEADCDMQEEEHHQRQDLATLPDLINAGPLGRVLGISISTVFRWRLTGKLPQAIKTDLGYLWVKTDIEEWIEAGMPWCDESRFITPMRHVSAAAYNHHEDHDG